MLDFHYSNLNAFHYRQVCNLYLLSANIISCSIFIPRNVNIIDIVVNKFIIKKQYQNIQKVIVLISILEKLYP